MDNLLPMGRRSSEWGAAGSQCFLQPQDPRQTVPRHRLAGGWAAVGRGEHTELRVRPSKSTSLPCLPSPWGSLLCQGSLGCSDKGRDINVLVHL